MAEDRPVGVHSRRLFLRFAFASVGGLTLLAACGPSSQAPSGASAPTSAPAAAPTTAPAAPKPTTPPAAGAPTPTAAAASIAAPTATPYPVANYGSSSAKVSIRYWTILGSVDGIVM